MKKRRTRDRGAVRGERRGAGKRHAHEPFGRIRRAAMPGRATRVPKPAKRIKADSLVF
jgi:hypothetical protein